MPQVKKRPLWGNPIWLRLNTGQDADITHVPLVLENLLSRAIIADQAYDCTAFIDDFREQHPNMVIVIPSKTNRCHKRGLGKEFYKERNKIELFFNRIKHCR